MPTLTGNPVYTSYNRQVNHWSQAAQQLSSFENMASAGAWQGLDATISNLLRQNLQMSVQRVITYANQLKAKLETASERNEMPRNLKPEVVELRNQYLKAEETIHFYTTAINSRTTPHIAALLRACDIICLRSMRAILLPLNRKSPYVLTYVDKGIGASILKAGLRLWDGNISTVAAVKVTQHNLFRPTAIIHETGHQMAHILNWNDELAAVYKERLNAEPGSVGSMFASWSSEIAADAFAFVHAGFASVAALHDVVNGTPQSIFTWHMHDPHPIGYVRVLLNLEMCRAFYGNGPWDDLELVFKNDYEPMLSGSPAAEEIKLCVKAIPAVVAITLKYPYRAFGNRSLSKLIDPDLVSPQALSEMEQRAGNALYTSHAWIWKECIRLLAHNGYKIALGQGDLTALYKLQDEWMLRLGFSIELN
jgi:hypothetical protein